MKNSPQVYIVHIERSKKITTRINWGKLDLQEVLRRSMLLAGSDATYIFTVNQEGEKTCLGIIYCRELLACYSKTLLQAWLEYQDSQAKKKVGGAPPQTGRH